MITKKPLLSIGMIFKNEIRCIERCMKSLEPLRRAIPCELVMADTGSTDGSRAIAEQYADILFNFTWVNDFSAARNAVMDRCSGKWYFSVDCDEWLDEDFIQLVKFLKNPKNMETVATVNIRNYKTPDLNPEYSMDFLGVRLLRMSIGLRYHGTIHEAWSRQDGQRLAAHALTEVVLHHDGYVVMEGAWGEEKIQRNTALLEEKLAKDPNDLTTLMQCIESSSTQAEEKYIRQALEAARAHEGHHRCIPVIYRYAVNKAVDKNLPETEEWIAEAEERYPDSAFTRIDISFQGLIYYWNRNDYEKCIRYGEQYLDYAPGFRAGGLDLEAQSTSTIQRSSLLWERTVRIITAGAYLNQDEGNPGKAREILEGIDYAALDVTQTENLMNIMRGLQFTGEESASAMVAEIWEAISRPEPDKKTAERRQKAFEKVGTKYFLLPNQEMEQCSTSFRRFSWTAFRGLPTGLGIGADVLSAQDTDEMARLLEGLEYWRQLPIQALDHALANGMAFPLSGKPLSSEDADMLAARLALSRPGAAAEFALKTAQDDLEDFQKISWARALVMAALKACKWDNPEQDMLLCRAFARVESVFLRLCFAPAAMQDDHLLILPPLHRFGWYCVRAFETLDSGDTLGYLRLLKESLITYEPGRPMVKFLSEHTQEVQAGLAPTPSEELMQLADQMRNLLASFAPDDPMVAVIKQSEDYQQLAHLIEGTPAPVIGGLKQ